MTKKRFFYLDLLKILAALFVVFNHYSFIINPNSHFSKILLTVMFTICKIAVPIFVMVSGALLLGKKASYKDIFTKRIVRVFVPLVIISIIYVFSYYNGLNFNNFFSFIFAIFTEYDINYIPYWIWYLYMIIALYIMTPFLQKMLKGFTKKDYKIFFALFLIGVGLINFLGPLTSVFLGEAKQINSNFTSNIFPIAIGYYVWGYYVFKLKLERKHAKYAWIVLLISLFSGMLFVNYSVYHKGFSYDEVINWSIIFVALASASLFVLAKYYFTDLDKPKLNKFIAIISDSAFGVYLTHVFLFDYLQKVSFIRDLIGFNSFVGCIFMVLLAFVILTVLFYFLRKVPLFRKFL